MTLNVFEMKYQKLHTKLYRLKNSKDFRSISEVQKELDECMQLAEQLNEIHGRQIDK